METHWIEEYFFLYPKPKFSFRYKIRIYSLSRVKTIVEILSSKQLTVCQVYVC